MTLNSTVASVTDRIAKRSAQRRRRYLDLIDAYDATKPARTRLSEPNQAHNSAACPAHDKTMLLGGAGWPAIGIVTAYNDMLSAHQPYEDFPRLIKEAARKAGAVAQVAGGVPAMCDGVTQGFEGMELSLFSRDVIALSTAVALSHATFDAALLLGICDKIVPGLLIGALRFPYLPAIFVPGGPMPSGLPNKEKAARRQLFAEGKISRA
ncbi:MAG: dihydroxy-acid dehydratase, partial [Hyphomonadaceae bacterium]